MWALTKTSGAKIISKNRQACVMMFMLNSLNDLSCRYSDKCYPINSTRQFIDADFIRLHCISTSLPTFGDVISREFFANVRLDTSARSTMEKWASLKSEEDHPPSIVILGVDTVSRLNSLRNFNKTLSVLRSIGAIEMKGYTKGEFYIWYLNLYLFVFKKLINFI